MLPHVYLSYIFNLKVVILRHFLHHFTGQGDFDSHSHICSNYYAIFSRCSLVV